MSGTVVAAALAAIVLALLWRHARLPAGGLYLVGAALMVALLGYGLQGRPSLAAARAQTSDGRLREDRAAIEVRRQMYGRFSSGAQWIDFSDTLLRLGASRAAVDALRQGLAKQPQSVPLWTALGSALAAHGDGQLSPAAMFAFERAGRIDPKSPAPPFFLGLALANAGDGDAAIKLWFDLLQRTPTDAPWRGEIERRLATLVLPRVGPMAPPPPVPVDGSGRPDGGPDGERGAPVLQRRQVPHAITGRAPGAL